MVKGTVTFLLTIASIPLAAASAQSPAVANNSSNRDFLARNYPPESLQKGEFGKVGFQLTIEPDGLLSGCAINQSSGFPRLDRGTCELLVYAAKLEPAKDDGGRAVRTSKSGFVTWKLPKGIQPATPAKADLAAKVEPLLCRRELVTGSNIKTGIRCMTSTDWLREERNAQQNLHKMQTEIGCTDHGC